MDNHRWHNHMHEYHNSKWRKFILGVLFLLLGLLLLLNNLGFLSTDIKHIVLSWQMLLIVIGLLNIHKGELFGWILIFIGLFFLLPKFLYFPFDYVRLFWPLLLIVIGLFIIFRGNKIRSFERKIEYELKKTESKYDIIEEINIFGGSRKSILSQKFMGGRIISVFGGTELDFTDAKLNEGTNFLEIICAFGGISIIMPSDWQVKSEVISIIGGFADRRTRISNVVITNNKELIIKGIAIFGGGDIKSFKE